MDRGETVREFYRKQGEQRERQRIIATLKEMRLDFYTKDADGVIGYHAGWDMGLHDIIDLLEGE